MVRTLAAALGFSLGALGCTSSSHLADPPPAASTSPAAVPRYLALGDSFTIGTGATPDRAFPARLVARCASAVDLRNVAVNGYSTADILDREIPDVAPFAPTFVTLAAGANDIVRGSSPEEYCARVRTILSALKAAGVARVVTLPQPDWSQSPAALAFGSPAAIHARIVEANSILRDETAAVDGVYVDLFPLMESQARAGMIARDGLHPSAAAYDAWAAELAARGLVPCQ
jgi:lysophospholipase L1-like esterase